MSERSALLDDYLSKTRWSNDTRIALAGDASMRRYTRLINPQTLRTVMLMDAPPEFGEDIRPFIKVARYLDHLGLSAPEILDADENHGFLVLEDLGNDLFDVICANAPEVETTLYDAAVDVLTTLAMAEPLGGLEPYQPKMLELALASLQWYVAPVTNAPLDEAIAACATALSPLIASLGDRQVTTLRDYHAQNLIWLPSRSAPASVGLLDFQDAMLGPVAYDLASLTTDARRDVPPYVRARCTDRMVDSLSLDRQSFERSAAICSAQRNLRILMVFARMSLYFKRPNYVDLIPRVWDHLLRSLSHPDLSELNHAVRRHFPEPTPENLNTLRAKCGTVSTLS